MPVFVRDKKHLLFIHVPKTGGTSIEMIFQLSGWNTAYLDRGFAGTLNHLRMCSPQHMHAEMIKQQFVLDRFNELFMVVRHPYDRFRSEYCYINKENCDRSAHAVEEWLCLVLKEYSTNSFILDNHVRPQCEFYLPGAQVYKLEDGFDSIVKNLSVRYEIDFVDTQIREMSREKENGYSSSEVELNNTVKNMLNIFYHQDFQQFGYKPDLVEELEISSDRHVKLLSSDAMSKNTEVSNDTIVETFNAAKNEENKNQTFLSDGKEVINKIDKNKVKLISASKANNAYDLWRKRTSLTDSDLALFSQIIEQQSQETKFHIIVRVEQGEEHLLADTIDSIGAQIYTNWSLSIIANFESTDPLINELEQIKWFDCGDDFFEKLQEVQELVESDWLTNIKAGDLLDPTFLYYLYFYIKDNPDWKFIYTDEDCIDPVGTLTSPQFKPDFNLDLARSMNYLGNSCIINNHALKNLEREEKIEEANCYDLFLRTFDIFGKAAIGHIPRLLFHSHLDSRIEKIEIKKQEKKHLESHLKRNNIRAKVNDGFIEHTFFITYKYKEKPYISIIIPTKNNAKYLKKCIFSILEKTDYKNYEIIIIDNNSTDPVTVSFLNTIAVSHPNIKVLKYKKPFNYSAINNYAINQAIGEYVLLLNDDTVALQGPWLDRMLQHAQRTDVGAVGARLVYSNKQLQHAGVVLGMYGLAHHPGIGQDMQESGYMNRLQVAQNFSAVTAACLLVKKSRYLEVGGMDEKDLKVLFNDVDFCIKLTEAGYRNVWTPQATLIHHGSSSLRRKKSKKEIETTNKRVNQEYKTMKDRWGSILANDPAYNRNLSLQKFNWDIDITTAVPWDTTIIERPRFFGVPNNSEGCAFYRVSEPLKRLRKTGAIWDYVFPGTEVDGFDMPSVINLKRIAPDSILLHSIFCKKEILQDYKRYTTACIIYGLDDLVTRIPKDHPNKSIIPRNVNNLLRNMLDICDRVIVSTEPLHDQITKKNMIDDIRIVPNYLPGDRWIGLKSLKRQGEKVRIGWAGALQHHGDLTLIEEVVKETHQEVEWVFLGMCPDYLRPYVQEFHPAVNINEYPQKLASLNLDIAVAPLEINPFNEAKSNLRLLEYGILGIPVIATNIFPYRNSPAVILENDPKLWITAIKERIDQPSAVEKEGEILRKWVLDNYLLENNAELWLEALTP